MWVPQQWMYHLTPLRGAPKQGFKAEVSGIKVVPGSQWCPPFSCKESSDGHCRGHGHLCPTARCVRSQPGSQTLQLVREEVGLQRGLSVSVGFRNSDVGDQMKEGGLAGYLETGRYFGPYFCLLERKGPAEMPCKATQR